MDFDLEDLRRAIATFKNYVEAEAQSTAAGRERARGIRRGFKEEVNSEFDEQDNWFGDENSNFGYEVNESSLSHGHASDEWRENGPTRTQSSQSLAAFDRNGPWNESEPMIRSTRARSRR